MQDQSGVFASGRIRPAIGWWIRFAAAWVCSVLTFRKTALALFGGATTRPPDIAGFRVFKGKLLAANGDHRAAALELLDCVRKNPGDVAANNELISALLELKLNEFADGIARNLVKTNAFLNADQRADLERSGVELTARQRLKLFLLATSWQPIRQGANTLSRMGRRRREKFVALVKGEAGTTLDATPIPARRRKTPATMLGRFNEWLDVIYVNIILVQNIILQRTKRNSLLKISPYITAMRSFVIIIGHVYLFWFMQKQLPGGVSYLSFAFPGFAVWIAFSSGLHQSTQPDIKTPMMLGRKIRWISLWAAALVWDVYCILAAVFIILFYFYVIGDRDISGHLPVSGFPHFVTLLMLAYCLGTAFGYAIEKISEFAPFMKLTTHFLLPILMITSGMYEAFNHLPWQIQQYVVFNPVAPITENARRAFAPHYDVYGLTLYYPLAIALAGIALLLITYHGKLKGQAK